MSHLCDTCAACPAARRCARSAAQFLDGQPDSPLMQRERLRIALVGQALGRVPGQGVEGQGARTRPGRLPITALQQRTLDQLPKPVATMARKLFERGWFDFARREMLQGRNPGANGWQRVLCAHLIDGGVSRSALQLAYQGQLGMTAGSAKVRVSRAVALFTAGALLAELDGRLQLRRN